MATQEDATLMMQVLSWSTDAGMMEATRATMAPDFDPTTASATDAHVLTLLMVGETIGTLVKQGLLDRDLVDDLWAAGLVWNRVGSAALRNREEIGEPRLWENFERLAAHQ